MHVLHLVGARPNFMKAAAVIRSLERRAGVQQTLIHTGQHYDPNMSDVFFRELDIPEPALNLQVGSGSHASQTAEIIRRFEPVVQEMRPDIVLVYGDVNSTLAGAIVCSKLLVKVGHVEAGLRSFDRTMPEEINRLLTDQIADLLFTPSLDASENLAREGINPEKVHFVGNVMIDTLFRLLPLAREKFYEDFPSRYALVTLHRPSNVDDVAWLAQFIDALHRIGETISVVFAVHPRTRQRILEAGIIGENQNGLRWLEPLPYLEFLSLQARATLVITDSGGIQEETTILEVPCVTVRENTERPVTIEMGTNSLVGRDIGRLQEEVKKICAGKKKESRTPPLWDGHAADRIADFLTKVSGSAASLGSVCESARSSL